MSSNQWILMNLLSSTSYVRCFRMRLCCMWYCPSDSRGDYRVMCPVCSHDPCCQLLSFHTFRQILEWCRVTRREEGFPLCPPPVLTDPDCGPVRERLLGMTAQYSGSSANSSTLLFDVGRRQTDWKQGQYVLKT